MRRLLLALTIVAVALAGCGSTQRATTKAHRVVDLPEAVVLMRKLEAKCHRENREMCRLLGRVTLTTTAPKK